MALEFNFLGDLTVLRDGDALELPPSRKTRALLAYLALNPRAFNREHLCELLWEVPDDPRGSLRWSLSKLRRLVDDAARRRLVADRLSVRLDATDVAVDVAALKALAESGLAAASVETLEDASARYRGNFLEGLDLSSFHQFHAWCIAEREHASRAQTAVLNALVTRLSADPPRALVHAHALVALAPYDEAARAALIRLLVALGRAEEAARQYELGTRMLREMGTQPTGRLYRALHGVPGAASAT
ncbi:MAG TPA: BTAD domain-containing putative transcriptional regulator, partial [Steroidobacteraceae bacterium]|nr:BTAD domain-containing putative transcriptional regulator [Steroidobacteraceae bacterium]